MNELLKIGAQMPSQRLGLNLPPDAIAAVLPQLLQRAGGGDLAGLAEQALGSLLGGGKRS